MSSSARKNLGVLVDERVDMSQHCVLKGKKANLMHQKKPGRHVEGSDSPLLLRYHKILPETLCPPSPIQDMDQLGQVQRMATKIIWGLEHCSQKMDWAKVVQSGEETIPGWPYSSLTEFKGDLRESCRGTSNKVLWWQDKRHFWFKLNIRKKYFTMRVMKHWLWLSRDVVTQAQICVPPLETFKVRLTFGQPDLVKDVLFTAGWPLQGPFHLKLFCILSYWRESPGEPWRWWSDWNICHKAERLGDLWVYILEERLRRLFVRCIHI